MAQDNQAAQRLFLVQLIDAIAESEITMQIEHTGYSVDFV